MAAPLFVKVDEDLIINRAAVDAVEVTEKFGIWGVEVRCTAGREFYRKPQENTEQSARNLAASWLHILNVGAGE
jgi:hypothetical protein